MFTHLHVHTAYSLLDSINKIDELLQKTQQLGQKAIAITDHGNMYGAVEFYKKAKQYNIKPIIGCECYICEDISIMKRTNQMYHLILLAKNETGRINLQKLVKESTRWKFNKRPRIDFRLLAQYHEGLICMSACMAGEVSSALLQGNIEDAIDIAKKYKNLFGDDYYIEYQAHNDPAQQKLNRELVRIANTLGIKYAVTCDVHYLEKEDQKYHSVFVQIGECRETGETYNDCYLQSEAEVIANSASTAEFNTRAIQTTQEITDKCNVDYPLSAPIIPHVSIPKEFKNEKHYLQYLCNKGFHDKGFDKWDLQRWRDYMTKVTYDQDGVAHKSQFVEFNSVDEIVNKYKKRVKYEMHAVTEMGFEGYYLLVRSYISAAKRRGPARGSAGGSLLAFLSGIVDIDPIKYGLYFERFIDVGALDLLKTNQITRKELKIPDVDADFSPHDRDKVMRHIIEHNGKDMVVNLGVLQYMKAKAAIKDIGKVLGMSFSERNQITKNIVSETIQQALDNGELDEYKDVYPELFEYASRLAGLPKSFGKHACGRVITMKEAVYYNALEYVPDDDTWTLQGDMHTADDLGLVKIDLLGLRTLEVIYDVLDMIGKDYDFVAPHKINLNDKKVWDEFANGNTLLIFQFESDGMRRVLQDMKCNCIDDLAVANALYRPGSLAYIPNYVARKHGTEPITYLNTDLEPILKNTYGIIVYQEQLIEIGRLAKLRNPDELRQATAKKKVKLMEKIEPELKNGLKARGWTQEQVDQLWVDIKKFAKYSFNKSHAAAYALTAYITMYMKVYYPVEFITAYINSYNGDTKSIAEVLIEAKRLNISYGFDNWRKVQGTTTCCNGKVWLGINTLKGFGSNVSNALIEIGSIEYSSFRELISALSWHPDINDKHIKALIKLDFFKEFGKSQKLLEMYELYDKLMDVKIINKSNMPVSEDIIRKYARETPAQYRVIDNVALYNEVCANIPDKDISISDQIKTKFELQGLLDYVNPKLINMAFVTNIDTKFSPKATIYCLDTGNIETYKISKFKFQNKPLNVGDIIQIYKINRKYKQEWNGEGYTVNTKAFDTWIDSYVVRTKRGG